MAVSPAPVLPRIQELQAPPAWRSIEFISDLHLHALEPETFETWRRYMRDTTADAVFILGDLFDVWVGDDASHEPGLAADGAAVLQAAAAHAAIFFMPGNRDFLLGEGFLRACGAILLHDPTVLGFAHRRWLLTHGDALCLADTDYMKFRGKVRDPSWQRDFLARPLAERKSIGSDLRRQSEERKGTGIAYAEVDAQAASAWLEAADAQVMIHGHTHRPTDHPLAHGRSRTVLSDWDARATPPRHEVLRLTAAGLQRVPIA